MVLCFSGFMNLWLLGVENLPNFRFQNPQEDIHPISKIFEILFSGVSSVSGRGFSKSGPTLQKVVFAKH